MKNGFISKNNKGKFLLVLVLLTTIFLFPLETMASNEANLIDGIINKIKVDANKKYDVIENIDGTKIYVVYNYLDCDDNTIKKSPTDIVESIDNGEIFEFPYDTSDSWEFNLEIKKEVLTLARNLNLNTILTKMKDFWYHPYTICEYDNFNLDELNKIKSELELLYYNYKEIDVGSPVGFVGDSIIANIKSVSRAIKNFDIKKYEKKKKIQEYIYKNTLLGNKFKFYKNLINTYFPIYENNYKNIPINSLTIRNFKDENELYYTAVMQERNPINISYEIGDKIKKGDFLAIRTKIDINKMSLNYDDFIVLKCKDVCEFKESDKLEKYYKGHKELTFDMIYDSGFNEKDRLNKHDLSIESIFLSPTKNDNYRLMYLLDEGSGNFSYQVVIPIRIKKNARIFGSYFYDCIDNFFSDFHDGEFEVTKNNDIYLNDVLGKMVNFHYPAKAMFFYPFEEKDFDEVYAKTGGYYYPNYELLDRIENIKVLTYDEKGYITGIYKGMN